MIHTDFQKGFIMAETMSYKDFKASTYCAAAQMCMFLLLRCGCGIQFGGQPKAPRALSRQMVAVKQRAVPLGVCAWKVESTSSRTVTSCISSTTLRSSDAASGF